MTLALVLVLLPGTYLLGLGVGEALGVTSADLVVVVVAAVALARGSVAGAVTGFGAGLLLDLAPGSTYPVGSGALAGTLAGGLLGLLVEVGGDGTFGATGRSEVRGNPLRSRPTALGRCALAAVLTAVGLLTQVLVRNGVGAVLGAQPDLMRPALLLPAAGTLLVAAFTVPGLTTAFGARGSG